MKRVLSFILVLAVFCSCMVIQAKTVDAEDTSVFEIIDNEAFEALKNMGLLTDDFLSINAGSAVTRAQFLGALYKLIGVTAGELDVSLPFSDVNINTPHRDAIAFFYTIGAVKGTNSSTFEPNGEITYIQAVKIIADFLGYKIYVQQSLGEYPAGYIALSAKLDLDYGITIIDNNAPISAEAVVRLIYNAANTPLFDRVIYNNKGEAVFLPANEDTTILTAYNNILYDEAVLQDNGVVSLKGERSTDGTVVIGGNKYKVGELDLVDYLGMELQFFYKSEDDIKTILWARANNHNEVLTISSENLAIDDPSYGFSKIVYWMNEHKRTVNIDAFADIVYNNALSNNASLSYIKPRTGDIKLIDNNNDGDYDIVIVKDYKNIFVKAVSFERKFIANHYGDSLDLSVYDNIKIFDENGKTIGLNEIASNRVISYLANPDSTDYIYIYVNANGKTSRVASISKGSDGTYYSFGNEKLKLAESLLDIISEGQYYVPEIAVGKTYTYYLDIKGNVAAVKLGNTSEQYALFIAAAPNTKWFASAGSYKIKLLLSDGITTVVTTSDKFKKSGYDDGIPLEEKGAQVVRVLFDGDGLLKEIKFAAPLDKSVYTTGFNNNEFTIDYTAGTTYYRDQIFDRSYAIDGTTLIFATILTAGNELTYEVLGTSSLWTEYHYDSQVHNGITYPAVRVYDADEFLHANVINITMNYETAYSSSVMLIDEVVECLNEDGDVCTALVGYVDGVEREYIIENPKVLPNTPLERGHLIKYALVGNTIHNVVWVCDLGDPTLTYDTTAGPGGYNGNSFAFGYLYSNDGAKLNLYNPDGWNNGNTVLVTKHNSGVGKVMVYDTKIDKIYVTSTNDLYQNCSPQSNGTMNVNEDSVKVFLARRFDYVLNLIAVYY